jgi:hypothetical protein
MRNKERDLSRDFGEMLAHLMEAGFKPPLHWAAIARNGSMMAGRYEVTERGDLDCEIVFSDEADMAVPVNLMFVDCRGEAARVVIGPAGAEILGDEHVS